MFRRAVLAAMALSASACHAAPTRPGLPEMRDGFGLYGCLVGGHLRMTVNDLAEGMIVRSPSSRLDLNRINDLNDTQTHVAAIAQGEHAVSVTINRAAHMTITVLGDPAKPYMFLEGDCEKL